HRRRYLFRVRRQRSRAKVEAERKLIVGHRLEVHNRVIVGAVPRRLDSKFRIASWVKAGVTTHHFFEAPPVLCAYVGSVIQRNETGIAMLQVEGFDKTMESKPVDGVFAGEQRS